MSKSQVVLITGGTSGLGLEIAQHYIKLGYKTVIFSKNKKLLKKILAIIEMLMQFALI